MRHPRACLTLGISCKGRGSLAGADLVSFIPLFDRTVLHPVVAVESLRPLLPTLIVHQTSNGGACSSNVGIRSY